MFGTYILFVLISSYWPTCAYAAVYRLRRRGLRLDVVRGRAAALLTGPDLSAALCAALASPCPAFNNKTRLNGLQKHIKVA